jgi:DNA-binding SARP family transcriptional activator
LGETLHVRFIGPPTIESSSGAQHGVRGQKAWALLARVLLADRPLTRRELSEELFPDTADPLGSLRWTLAVLRKALDSSEVLTGDPVRCDLPASVTVDVHALRDGDLDVDHVGEFLEGINPRCGPEFSTWLLVTRQQVASRVDARLREEIITSLSRADYDRAERLSELAVRRSPFDEGVHVLLVRSLALAGHPDAALAHVEEVASSFRRELGVEPSGAVRSAARAHVADPPPGVPAGAVASALLESGRAALAAGAIDAGLDCVRRAGAQAEIARDDALLARCLYQLGSSLIHSVRGYDDEGSILLAQAVHLARGLGDLATAVPALQELGYADALAGRRPEAQRQLELAKELADGRAGLLVGVHSIAGFNLSDWGRRDEGIECYQAALDCARRSGDRRREAWTLGLGGWAHVRAGRTEASLPWLTDCLTLVHQLGWISFEPWPSAVLAEATLAGNRRPLDGSELERHFALSCQLEDPCWEGASGRVLALHHAQSSDHDRALEWIVEARTRSVRKTDTWAGMLGVILLTEAELRTSAGDSAGARRAAGDLVALATRAQLDDLLQRGLAIAATAPSR